MHACAEAGSVTQLHERVPRDDVSAPHKHGWQAHVSSVHPRLGDGAQVGFSSRSRVQQAQNQAMRAHLEDALVRHGGAVRQNRWAAHHVPQVRLQGGQAGQVVGQ